MCQKYIETKIGLYKKFVGSTVCYELRKNGQYNMDTSGKWLEGESKWADEWIVNAWWGTQGTKER